MNCESAYRKSMMTLISNERPKNIRFTSSFSPCLMTPPLLFRTKTTSAQLRFEALQQNPSAASERKRKDCIFSLFGNNPVNSRAL